MLHKIIKTLNSHLPRRRSLPEQPQNAIPSLPLEIWWVILEMTLYSSPTVLEYFAPSEIVLAQRYFSGGLDMQAVMQCQNTALKKRLRQVCKGWKDIIDSIRTDYQQVQEHRYGNGQLFEANEQPTISDTRQYTMVTVETEASSVRKVLIKFRYTHPVSALTMRTIASPYYSPDKSATKIESLSDIVSFPKGLRVFKLHMDGYNGSMDLLQGIEEMSIPLTTLHLFLTDSLILQTCLTIPTLVNLLICIRYPQGQGIWTDPSRYQWKLPALRNLSIAQPLDDYARSLYRMTLTHPFYIELLKRHKSNLQSLLMDPMTIQVHDQTSSLWWANMPNLQVLAANFCEISPIPRARPNFLRTSDSTSVRHLIHFDNGGFMSTMGFELCRYIRLCTRLEGVTLVNRGSAVKWMTVDPVEGMTDLRDLCIERGIPMWSQSDVLKPKEIVTFVPMKK